MVRLIATVWLMATLTQLWADVGVRKSGPFRIVVENMASCDDEGTGEIKFGTKISRKSDGSHTYSDNVYVAHPIDQNTSVSNDHVYLFKQLYLELQAFGNGGYRPRFYHHTFKGCEAMTRFVKEPVKLFFKAANVTVDGCPLPAGNFTLKDLDSRVLETVTWPSITYNKYRTISITYYNGRKAGCLIVYGEAVPK